MFYLLSGDHRDNFSQLQLCAQHPVQVSRSQQCRSGKAGLHLHADHAHSETDRGLPS